MVGESLKRCLDKTLSGSIYKGPNYTVVTDEIPMVSSPVEAPYAGGVCENW